MSELRLDSAAMQWAVGGSVVTKEAAVSRLVAGAPLLVLMHGYGSNEEDLIGLTSHLPVEFVCVSPRAPLQAPMVDGYSWFPISLQAGGVLPDDAADNATRAAEAVLAFLDELSDEVGDAGASDSGSDSDAGASDARFGALGSIALMGFSQGGVMVTTLMRILPERFAAGVNCSGFVSPGEFAGDAKLKELRPPLFWGRDAADPVISQAAIDLTAEWVKDHVTLENRLYPGIFHSISGEEMRDISEFLERALAG